MHTPTRATLSLRSLQTRYQHLTPFYREILPAVGLVIVTCLVFWPVTGFDFVRWDDGEYVVSNPMVVQGLTSDSVTKAFTSRVTSHWHPITTLSHILDVEMFGLRAGWHHTVSLALHLANTLLLYLVLHAATQTTFRSALVAVLFAIHPLHVETVVWISDRKDLLCTLFGCIALYAYVRFVRQRDWKSYGISLVSFLLSLLSKPMLVTLPFLLILLDYWPLGRMSRRDRCVGDSPHSGGSARRRGLWLLVEKTPFFVLAAFGAIVAVVMDRGDARSMITFGQCAVNAVVSYVRYLGKMVWPCGLSCHYVHPNFPGGTPWAEWQVIGSLLVLLAISAVILIWVRRPYATVGWLWFLGTLFPVLGWNVAVSFAMADRYTYVPLIGPFIAIVWGAEELTRRIPAKMRAGHKVKWGVLAAVIVALMIASHRQSLYWRDSETLLRRQLTLFPADAMCLVNLGNELAGRGEHEEAFVYLSQAVAIDPDSVKAKENFRALLAQREGHVSSK